MEEERDIKKNTKTKWKSLLLGNWTGWFLWDNAQSNKEASNWTCMQTKISIEFKAALCGSDDQVCVGVGVCEALVFSSSKAGQVYGAWMKMQYVHH